jgi:hypothetical protein
MKRINVFVYTFIFSIASMLFPSASFLRAEEITLHGEMKSGVTAYLTRRFSSYSNTKNLTYKMMLPATQTEGLHTQTIDRLRKNFTPYPTDIKEFTDEYGNSGLSMTWNKEIYVIQIDLQFTASIYANFYRIDSSAAFPLAVDQRLKPFIASTDLAPSNDFMINYIGRSISYGLNSEVDVVKNIFNWIDVHIKLSNGRDELQNHGALSVLRRQSGDERGICNLAASIFKGLGIPVRVVYGISYQQEIPIHTDAATYFFEYPNDEKFWLEVFFPDLGWIPYDPIGSHFGTVSHVIKFSVGPDSDYASDQWDIEVGDIIEFKEFIFDIRSDEANFEVQDFALGNKNRIILSPLIEGFNVYSKEPELDVGEADAPATREERGEETGPIVQNSDISKRLDVVATQNRVYAQRFSVDEPFTLTQIQIPLIKFADEGRIWLEIYEDEEGTPGNVLFKTYSIHSPRVRFMMTDNPWLSFPVGKKTDSFLEVGSYWIALRSSGTTIFNWYASSGNVFSTAGDTRFRDTRVKNSHWNNVMNFDLTFQVYGTREPH